MLKVKTAAMYLFDLYSEKYNEQMDQMKLNKLLFLAQQESYALYERPLLKTIFYANRFGPVLKEVCALYNGFTDANSYEPESTETENLSETDRMILEKVFTRYAAIGSWSLSRRSRGSISWKSARMGLNRMDPDNPPMLPCHLRQDGIRLRKRREALQARTAE